MRRLAPAIALAFLVGVAVPAADASFPGRNGRIVFVSNRAPNYLRPQIYEVRADGSGRRAKLSRSAQPESAPAVSPDGRQIAFIRSGDLFVMRANGGDARNLVDGVVSGREPDGAAGGGPAWSPDGKLIAVPLQAGGIAVVPSQGGDLKQVTGDGTKPSWAPNGKSLAFERHIKLPRSTRGEIHVVRVDGTGETKIGDGFRPSWSPRGQRIAFVSGDFRVTVVRPDGSEPTDLGASNLSTPAWAPNGGRIAVSRPVGSGYAIVVVSVSGTGTPEQLTGRRDTDYDPVWAPNGRQIAFVRVGRVAEPEMRQLWTVDATSRRTRRLTREPPGSVFDGFSWTRDGRQIVFATEQNWNDGDIFSANRSGEGVRRLTDNFPDEHWPRWSSDGRRIVFVRGSAVYTMRADGSAVMKVTSPNRANDVYPNWSPDGRRIAFVRYPNLPSRGQVFIANADGTRLRRISREAGEYTDLTWSPDGAHFAFRRGGRVFAMRADGSKMTPLTAAGPGVAWGIAWSPDSRRIAFGRGSPGGIGAVSADGTGEAVLVRDVMAVELAWSPDGRQIAFRNTDFRSAVAEIASGNVRVLETGAAKGNDYEPDWQPLR